MVIADRQIVNAIHLLKKVCTKGRIEGKYIGIIFKLNLEKAYNDVDWPFLHAIFSKKGLSRW